jgi:hypothetical protein
MSTDLLSDKSITIMAMLKNKKKTGFKLTGVNSAVTQIKKRLKNTH